MSERVGGVDRRVSARLDREGGLVNSSFAAWLLAHSYQDAPRSYARQP